MPSADTPPLASGVVVDATRSPVAKARVRALWPRFRRDEAVGESTTDERGRFEFELDLPEGFPVDGTLRLEAIGSASAADDTPEQKGRQGRRSRNRTPSRESVRTAPLRLAETTGVVLRLPARVDDEYGFLRGRIEELTGRVPLRELRQDEEYSDLSFLSGEIGAPVEQVMRVVVAEHVAERLDVDRDPVYALLRLGVPSSIPADLLAASDGFAFLDPLVEHVATQLADLEPEVCERALRAAAQRGLVSPSVGKNAARVAERLQSEGKRLRLERPLGTGKTPLGRLLGTAGLDEGRQLRFAAAWREHEGSAERFWRRLVEDEGFAEGEVEGLRRTLDVGALVKNHIPMMDAVERLLSSENDPSLPELARLELDDWIRLVESAGEKAVPENILPGEDESPVELYAREVFERVQRRYPTTALAARIERGGLAPEGVRKPLATFFRASPDLDLVQANLGSWLEEHGSQALGELDEEVRSGTVRELEKMQRVLRISRDPRIGEILLSAGLDSAAGMYALGRSQILDQLAQRGLAPLEAQRVYSVSAMRHAASMALLARFNGPLRGIYPSATGPAAPFGEPVDDAIRRHPSLANLFGSQDACAVDPCTSILSPAAYLSDLLLWLRNRRLRAGSPFANPLEALRDRRGDILDLELNCPNTNTPLPYIDLVNELLEDAVSPPSEPVSRQTTRSAEELRAAPEYVNDGAYEVLADEVFPHALPYERAFDEMSVILDRSEVPLWQLREGVVPVDAVPDSAHATGIAAARMGIGPAELELIVTPTSAPGAAPLSDVWNTPDPVFDLAAVADFLQAAQLDYDELLQVLACRWPRAGGDATRIVGADDRCDTSVQRLEPLDAERLDRLHRFLRLWRRTGWEMWEVDELLRAPAVGDGTLDAATIRGLATVTELQETTRLPVDALLAMWQDLGTDAHRGPGGATRPSLYARTFEDPRHPAAPELELGTLLAASPPPPIESALPAIRAALSLTPEEGATLVAETDGQLTLASLGIIYRRITLARALRIELSDAAYLAGGVFADAFTDPAATRALAERARAVALGGLGVAHLRYVLTDGLTEAARSEGALAEILGAVRTAMQQVADDVAGAADDPLATLRAQLGTLASLADSALLDTAMAIVDGSHSGGDADRNAFIATHFTPFVDVATAQSLLALPLTTPATPPGPREDEIADRAAGLLAPLVRWLTESRVVSAVASQLSIPAGVADHLLRNVDGPGTPGRALLSTLTDPELIERDPASGDYLRGLVPADLPEAFQVLRLLDKQSAVVRGLRISADEVAWLLRQGPTVGALDLALLPVLPSQPEQSVDRWLATTAFVGLDREFDAARNTTPPLAVTSLRGFVDAVVAGTFADEAAVHAALAGITGWSEGAVAAGAAALGITTPPAGPPPPPNPWTQPRSHERLRRLLAMAEASGATVDQLIAWGSPSGPTQAHAEEAWRALKSRYETEAWLEIAPSIMDTLRERRRDALVWHLLAQRDGSGDPVWGVDTADLFGRFLLDPEMSSCQVTTRIVQAYGAVQLFVQRILMNLERDAEAHVEMDEAWEQWSWMDRYRVWEAGRKVFLYPENWLIEPQRPDRSEIFVALDRAVQQREATADALQSAALGYLDQLAAVAQPRVTGMCSEPRSGTLYVVGRVADDPPRFFLRRFENRRWTPWMRIEVDIAGRSPVPVFYAGRLHLFWLQTVVANEPQQRLPATDGSERDSEAPDRFVELKVYGTSLRDDVWQPPALATQSAFDKPVFFEGRTVSDLSVESLYTLKTQTSGAYLLIDVYRRGPSRGLDVVAAAMWDAFEHTELLEVLLDSATHLARIRFDGRFAEFQLRDLEIDVQSGPDQLLERARARYGSRAVDLVELPEGQAEPDLPREFEMHNEAGALALVPERWPAPQEAPLRFEATVDTGTLLERVRLPYRVIGLANDAPFTPESPFVFSDAERSWFVEPTRYWRNGSVWSPVAPSAPGSLPTQLRFRFHRFYHPFVRSFRHVLSSRGFGALYRPEVQEEPEAILPDTVGFSFAGSYLPRTPRVRWGEDGETVDFAYDGPYAPYNWELFLHLPLFIAGRLVRNQRFDEAREWFHHVFDPTRASNEPSPQRYWTPRPFRELTDEAVQEQRINELLGAVNRRDADALGQVARWRADPFNPFLLADLRPVAHMKRVVMSYLDMLIAWGDALFATASREALNEATLLYVMASELLGPRPQLVPPPERAAASWNDLEPELDAFANALTAIENYVPPGTGAGGSDGDDDPPLPPGQAFFFKIPPNRKLLDYWDTVEDRLFKLRHCRGLGGEPLLLPLFDAPIDPALLVRARAGGLDLDAVLLELGAPLPNYRFAELHRRAAAYTDAVLGLGASLLRALESRDAEALAALLSSHRRRVHADSRQILEWQLEEAKALEKGVEYAIELEDEIIEGAEEAAFMTPLEITSATMKSFVVAQKLTVLAAYAIAGGLAAIPNFLAGAAGVGGSPQAAAETGGSSISSAAEKGAKAWDKLGESLEKGADLVKVFAEAEKRYAAKQKEGKYAEKRKKEAEQKLEAARIRIQIAEYQLAQFEQGADDLDSEREFLRSKFSNEELYDWMVDRLSELYFRSYRLAMAMARRAERCYRFELGLVESDVIGPGSWDSLHRGLLAGESLALDLRRLESSYLERNVRRREITRTISLVDEFPDQLLSLLLTGSAEIDLDELFFDRDYPGHYQRRIVRASISVVRPGAAVHDNVVCTLTLLRNSVRLVPALGGGYPRLDPPESDTRFADQFAAVQGIVTGNAIDDPGLFVRDIGANLGDPRYLPFENAGAISRWRVELPAGRNALDLSTVRDVRLHLHYSALDGGGPLAEAAQEAVDAAAPATVSVAFDLETDFPEAWSSFFSAGGEQRFELPLRPGLLPPVARGRSPVVSSCTVHLFNDAGRRYEVALSNPFPTDLTAVEPPGADAIVATGSVGVPSVPLQPLQLRIRERGSGDWASLPEDALAGAVVELELGLT